ncbi:unnamed protein product [Adineta steineri]|uniref:Reverse transcriptase domain-containing protein n=1 Tax=Adineta steineri TaxID=433720 RepID=A0A815SLU4_9BILA|nr:unnamed protein product [Adineta steineri]CAF1641147.1 unnamed protein product [Adineta steineri]
MNNSSKIPITSSLSSITTTDNIQQQQTIVKKKQKRIKRCHGDRKKQRYRKKCRAKGMKPATIAKREKKRFKDNNNPTTQLVTTNDDKVKNNSATASSNKRKRDLTINQVVRSASQLSITTSPPKKMTKTKINNATTTTTATATTTSMVTHNDNIYRCAPYLKRTSSILLQALRLQLEHPLKKKIEQRFIFQRLELLDKQFCLELHRFLWQSYLNIGSQEHSQQYTWPDEIHTMFQTKDSRLCYQSIEKYIYGIQYQLDQCNKILMEQNPTCPESISIDMCDLRLKKYIESQQKQFHKKINHQLSKFKECIQEKQFYHTLFNDNLTQDQDKTIHQLVNIQDEQLNCWKELLKLEQHILSKFLDKNFDHLQNFITSNVFYSPIIADDDSIVTYQLKNVKTLQESKRIWLDIYLQVYMLKIQQHDQHYQYEFIQLKQCLNNTTESTELFQSIQTYLTQRSNRLKQEIYLEINYFERKLTRRRHQYSSKTKQMIGVSPEVILDVHPRQQELNSVEREYLCRGGSYIRPNRTILHPYAERKKLVQKEHDTIFNKTKQFLLKSCQSIPSASPLFKQFSERLHTCLTLHYMTTIPYKDHARAKQEREIIKSIRRKLKRNKLILRQCDKSGNLYVGEKSIFEQKATQYRVQTGAYEELSSNPLEDILMKVTRLLNDLHAKTKDLSPKQYKKMMPLRKNVRLAHMYFNPKTHKDPVTLRPIMNTIHAATTGISHFLDDLIRPLFNKHAQPKPIADGNSLLRQLEQYAENGYLQPTTLFCTFDITNLYTMLPQHESLDSLENFLRHYNLEKDLQGISINVIRQLAETVLKETAFFYDNKYYKQIVGGAMGSPFTLTLANIFMWQWENNIICKKLKPNEICGRYIDDMFFTSNESKETIEGILKDANDFHPNIKLEANIGHSVSFLDLLITNQNGNLVSSVYHKLAAEPCVIPFNSDHTRHTFGNIIQVILLRAIRYSSTLESFQKEYRRTRLMLLYNGKLLAQSSVKEIQINRQIDSIGIKQTDKPNKFDKTLFLHYTHEKRLEPIKRDIHKIYSDVFQGTEAESMRLIIGHRNSRNLARELIRTRPYASFIKLPSTKKSNVEAL